MLPATGSQVDPSLAYGSTQDAFLVAWSDGNDAFARRVASDADLLGTPITLANASGYQTVPDVGYNTLTEDFLAVWRDTRGGSASPVGYGQVVQENGDLSGSNQSITTTYMADRIATSGAGDPSGRHLVVWANSSNAKLYGQRFRPLDAGFTATPTAGIASLAVQFTDTSTPDGVADEWYWSFGDSGTSSQENPIYTYTAAGLYTVTQRVTDTATGEWNVLTHTDLISVTGPELITTTITYTYDSLYRLTEADYSSGENFQYVYDAVGNRTSYTATITSTQNTTYSYDAANRLVNVSGVAYTWDDLGRLVNDGTYTLILRQAQDRLGMRPAG